MGKATEIWAREANPTHKHIEKDNRMKVRNIPWVRALLGLLLVALFPLSLHAQGPRSTNNIFTMTNDTSTGTAQYYLLKEITATKVIKAAVTDTAISLYPCVIACGTTGEAKYITSGGASCFFDSNIASGATGYFVLASVTTAGKCHAQAAAPTTGMVIGKMLADSTVNTTAPGDQRLYRVEMTNYTPGTAGASSVSNGNAHSLAYYPSTGTTVDDLPASPTNNKALKGNGTDFVTSTADMAGAGACSASTVVTATMADAAPTCSAVTSARVDTSVAITGAGLNTSSQPIAAPTTWAFSGDVTPTPLGGDIHNYTGCDGGVPCRVNGGAVDRNWTGLASGTDGRLVNLCNIGTTNTLTLVDQSGSSSAGNKFLLGGVNVLLRPNACKPVWYDSTSSAWRLWDSAPLLPYLIKTCTIPFGSEASSAPPLVADDDVSASCGNNTGLDWKITGVKVWTKGGTTGTKFRPVLTGGTDILSADCAGTGTVGAWVACAITGTPIVHSFSGAGSATCSVTPCDLVGAIATVDGSATAGAIELTGPLQ